MITGSPEFGAHPEAVTTPDAAIYPEVGRLINQGKILSIGRRRLAHELWGQPGVGSPISHGICG